MFTELVIPAGRRPLTASEARISAILGTIITLILLAAVVDQYSVRSLSVLFLVLFWVPMLVVHELGHAVVARLLGWRVREIVIGFGRDLWQWQVGDTRVRIKLAPVEGYVLPAPAEPDNVRLKSMLIYAAGPGAELLVLGFMLLALGWDAVFSDSDEVSLIAAQSLAIVILFGAGFNLLPFRTDGAVSDGLGILSSPFMNRETIELRLLTFELREIRKLLDAGKTGKAVQALSEHLEKYPENEGLRLMYVSALSADEQDEAARTLARERLADAGLPDSRQREWLHLQAEIELHAAEPSWLVLDLALRKALAITPKAPDLIATKGASLVLRGQCEEGGNMVAHAWRANDGSADDATMLAYLTVAAHRCRDGDASERFRQAFEQVNRSRALRSRVDRLTGHPG